MELSFTINIFGLRHSHPHSHHHETSLLSPSAMSHQQPKNSKQPQVNGNSNGNSKNNSTGQPAQQLPAAAPLQRLPCGHLSRNPPFCPSCRRERARRNAITDTFWPYAISHLAPLPMCKLIFLYHRSKMCCHCATIGPECVSRCHVCDHLTALCDDCPLTAGEYDYRREDSVRPMPARP